MPSIVTNALETPLGKALDDSGMVDLADERPKESGKVFGKQSGPDGLSVRVFSAKAIDHTVNVFYQQPKGRPADRLRQLRTSSSVTARPEGEAGCLG